MRFKSLATAAALSIAGLLSTPATGLADGIKVDEPWARATAASALAGAAYFSLINHGASDDRLVRASADVSKRVELHTHEMDGGIMRMKEVDGITVPKGGTVALEPGGLHVMFIGLNGPLVEGRKFPLTLEFEKSPSVTVDVTVQAIGAKGAMQHDHSGHGHGGHSHDGHGHDHDKKGMKHSH